MRLTLTVARAATDRALFQVIPTVFPFNPESLAFMEPEQAIGIPGLTEWQSENTTF
jgi:hypothetical protein